MKADGIYVDNAEDIQTRFDTNKELERALPKNKNKKVIGLMKDELGGKIMTGFAALGPKTCSYLTDDNDENEKKLKTQKGVS